MMGTSALVLGAMFTSCSHDSGVTAEEYYKAVYEQKFVDVFGTPSPNQTWGFGPQGSTRATRANPGESYPATHEYTDANGNVIAGANMNHNQWGSTDLTSMPYGGWIVPDPLTAEQKLRVQLYFQANPNLSYEDPHFRHFYVQQVYTGGTSAPTTGNHEATAGANGETHQGMTLNQLTVGEACSHINDFNAGSCTTSQVLNHEGKTQNDEITLMVNVYDTSCFGYHETSGSNTGDNNNHNDKMALVSAATIDAWAAQNGNPGAAVTDKWNRSFMGFDYELLPESEIALDSYAELWAVPNLNNCQYAWDGEKVMTIGEAPEAPQPTEREEFDLTPYFAENSTGENVGGGTVDCNIVDGKIVCSFKNQWYNNITFKQRSGADWTSYDKLVIEFDEPSPLAATLWASNNSAEIKVGDTQVEVALSYTNIFDGSNGPSISTGGLGDTFPLTLTIKKVTLVKEAKTPVVDTSIVYYNPTYLLGDNDADKIAFYSNNTNMYGGIIREVSQNEMYTTQDGKTCLDLTFFQTLKANGYHPITSDLRTWVKWQAACDGYYSDWIVTLTEAKRIDEEEIDIPDGPTTVKLRVMAEDVSVSDASDFDFNDVVFDVVGTFAEGETTTNTVTVQLLAAGGTLPLYISGIGNEARFEVHAAFGVSTNTMTNTHAQSRADNVKYFAADGKTASPVTITLNNNSFSKDNFGADVRDYIKIEVEKEGGALVQLSAPTGMVASKIGCPQGTPWALERVNMNDAFKGFTDWVTKTTPADWYNYKVTGKYFE